MSLFPARTPTLPPATHTNSYALGTGDVLLVEPATPYEDEQRDWIAWARSLASVGRKLLAIVLTHHHADHAGGAAVFARELSLPLWAHAETARRVTAPVARLLVDGETIALGGPTEERWRVLHTPGHAPGHVCLFHDESGTGVVGDMVASVGTILIAPGDGDMAVYLEQLERLAALGARLALPAHGEPITEPTRLFLGYIEHRLMREARVLAAVGRSGPSGATAEALLGDAYEGIASDIREVALLSLRSHLAKLVAEGRVRATDGVRYSTRS